MSTTTFPNVLSTVRCRRPRCGEWFRVRPGDDWILEAAIFRDAVRGARYLVSRFIWEELGDRISRVTIRTCLGRSGETFLWAIPDLADDGAHGGWAESAQAIAAMAEEAWCTIAPVVSADQFAVWEAGEDAPKPIWSDTPLWKLLAFAFRDRVIEAAHHPALRRQPQ